MSHLDRFRNTDVLVDAMQSQKILNRDLDAAEALAKAGTLVEFAAGSEIIRQGEQDSTAFFLLSGKTELIVKGKRLGYGREAGEVIGEFAAINTALRRTATVEAETDVVALAVNSEDLVRAANEAKSIWRLLAIDLTRKVEQRNALINSSNEKPLLFLVATEEFEAVAKQLELALDGDFEVSAWDEKDLAPPSSYELERLRSQAAAADFAIVLAHPRDLWRADDHEPNPDAQSVLFELGYIIAELGRNRTMLIVPEEACGESLPPPFKGLKPWSFPAVGGAPIKTVLAGLIRRIEDHVRDRKVRSRLVPDD